jgi:membrane fusion protein (multidrug efflux system)
MTKDQLRRILIGGGVVAAIGVSALAVAGDGEPAGETAQTAQPTPLVSTERVKVEMVSPETRLPGRVEAERAVDVPAQVQGVILSQHFQDGDFVRAGQLLFTLDQATYAAQVEQAQAQVLRAQAVLTERETALARATTLAEKLAVSRAALDEARANRGTAAADLALARAQLRAARVDLARTRIAAPISGRAGKAAFNRGALVGPQGQPLVRIVQVDPVRVVFSINERDLLTARQNAAGASQEALNAVFRSTLELPNGSVYPGSGRVEFVDNEADRNTGTLAVRAVFDNPRGLLVPGQTLMVRARDARAVARPTVPSAAVQEDVQGAYVYVVGAGGVAQRRTVRVGAVEGDRSIIEQGLNGGETVVVAGLQKVRPGAPVRVRAASDRRARAG